MVRLDLGAEFQANVSIDGQPTGLLVSVIQQDASLRMTVESLRELGLDPARFGVADRTDFLLDEIDGMTWRYDSATQTLALTLSDRLRVARVISARTVRASGAGQASRGMLLNYNVFAQSSGGRCTDRGLTIRQQNIQWGDRFFHHFVAHASGRQSSFQRLVTA